jgi:hypothetical protein
MTQIITQKPLATLTLFTQEIVQENFEKPLEHFIKILG